MPSCNAVICCLAVGEQGSGQHGAVKTSFSAEVITAFTPQNLTSRDLDVHDRCGVILCCFVKFPKDHWTLKTGYFEDPNPAIQVQTLPLEGPRSLGFQNFSSGDFCCPF